MSNITNEKVVKLIDLLDAHLEEMKSFFNPFSWKNEGEKFFRRKAFSELAILSYVNRNFGVDTDSNNWMLDALYVHTNDAMYADLIRRNPRNFLLFCSSFFFKERRSTIG